MKIKCHTLFDVTKTNVNSRRQGYDGENTVLEHQRGQQSNFETVLQIVSMRGQPEDISDPEKSMESLAKSKKWGTTYTNKTKVPVWEFTFVVDQPAVFNDGISEIGNLVKDSHGIPIVIGLDEWSKISNTIDTTVELRNIYFEVMPDEPQVDQ